MWPNEISRATLEALGGWETRDGGFVSDARAVVRCCWQQSTDRDIAGQNRDS
ncbi:MAG: hypothetical protein Q6353_009610 [Candidatus Sigynarchaeum springense]